MVYIFDGVHYNSPISTSNRAVGPLHSASATPWHRRINLALRLSSVFLPVMGPGCGKLLEIEEGKKRNKEQRNKIRRRRHIHSYRCIYQPKVALLHFDSNSPSGTKHHQKWSANRSRWLNLDIRAMDTNRTKPSSQMHQVEEKSSKCHELQPVMDLTKTLKW